MQFQAFVRWIRCSFIGDNDACMYLLYPLLCENLAAKKFPKLIFDINFSHFCSVHGGISHAFASFSTMLDRK